MPDQVPVVILGAGPGGLSAAMFLSRAGIPSVVLERESFPRDKICGDALSGKVVEVLRKLDPGYHSMLAAEPVMLPSWGVTFVAPNRSALRVPFRKSWNPSDPAPGFISRRTDFDHWLFRQAEIMPGVEVRQQTDAHRFTQQEDGSWQILNRDGAKILNARIVIAADGAQSRFARQAAGFTMEPRHHCAGIRGYFSGVSGMDQDHFIELHFLPEFLPGYFWIFPLPGGFVNVGAGMRSDYVSRKKINLKAEVERIIRHDPLIAPRFQQAVQEDGWRGFGLPLGSKRRKISGNGFMLVGDAGSLIDPFTGEGIGNAMLSGMLAAQTVADSLQAGDASGKFLQRYDDAVWKRLGDELKLSSRMQQLVNFPWLFNLVVKKAHSNPELQEMISCMFEDLDLRDRLRDPRFWFRLLFT